MEISSLYGEIRRQVRNCPEPTMRDAILRAARDFCSDTWLLRRTFSFNTVVGIQRYDIQVPENEQAICIKHAQIAYTTAPVSAWPLFIVYPTTMNPNIGNGMPQGICMVPYTQVALDRPADQVYAVTVETVTQPVPEGNTIPDEIGVRYDRAIGYGALSWLMLQNGNPWYNPPLADKYQVMFNQEIVKGRGEAAFDFSPGTRQWMNPGFTRTGYGRIR